MEQHPIYAGVRMVAWWTVWFAVHLDAFINRNSRGRGWRLHRGILAFLTLQIVEQTVHFSVVIQYTNHSTFNAAHSDTFKAEIFFVWLARSVFLGLILLVSAGYCILRENLGENVRRVVAIPIVYGVTSMVLDYILLSSSNEHVVTQQTDDEAEIDSEDIKALVLITCLLVKAVVFVCAWVFVFENLNREIRMLRGDTEEIPALENEEPEDYERPEMQNAVDGGGNDDADAPKTVAEAVGDQAKLLLLARFRTILVIYVISIIMVNILPLYIANTSVEKIQSVVIVLENLLLIGFVISMAVIFRPVDDNPYLLLVDDLDGTPGKEVTTELGVIAFEPSTPQQSTTVLSDARHERDTGHSGFALADEDDLDLQPQQRQTSASSTPTAAIEGKRSPSPPSGEGEEE